MRESLRVGGFYIFKFLSFYLLLVSTPAIADAPDTLWTKTYGGTGSDGGHSVQECASGGFIITGGTYSFGAGKNDVYLIRTDADGDTLWTKTYGGTSGDRGHSVQECASGGFIIAGQTYCSGADSCDVYLIRTNADGDTLWTKTYGGTDYDEGSSVQECASGGFIIAGYTLSFGAGNPDVYLIRTDVDGDTLWTKTYGGTGGDFGNSVQECDEGGFIVAGSNAGDVWLIRTNADGDTLWTKTYGGARGDWGVSVQKCAGGGFIIAGATGSFGAGSQDVYLIRTDADGDTMWTKTYGGTEFDDGWSVQECAPTKSGQASGGFIIAGYTWSFGAGRCDVYLIRTDADGDTLWTKTYGGTEWDLGNSVKECASGGFIIAGSSAGDVYLIRISEAGVEERNERLEIEDWRLRIYPNPFTRKTEIRFQIPDARCQVSLKVYDLAGQLVRTLITNDQLPMTSVSWDGKDKSDKKVAGGIYFIRLETGEFKAVKKLVILR